MPYKNLELKRAYERRKFKRRYLANPEAMREINRRSHKKRYQTNPELREKLELAGKTTKGLARKAVRNAVARGKLVRPTNCCMCGSGVRIHAHHFDYSRPLWVIWVCAICHSAIHRSALPTSGTGEAVVRVIEAAEKARGYLTDADAIPYYAYGDNQAANVMKTAILDSLTVIREALNAVGTPHLSKLKEQGQ